jgi:hypothetical protein
MCPDKGFPDCGSGVYEKCSAFAYSLLQHYVLFDELLGIFVEYRLC